MGRSGDDEQSIDAITTATGDDEITVIVRRVFTTAGLTQALPFEPETSAGAANDSSLSSPQT